MQIGEAVVSKQKLSLFTELNNVLHVGNKFYVAIPEYIVGELYLIALQYHQTEVFVNMQNYFLFDGLSMLVEYICYGDEKRRNIATNPHSKLMQQITCDTTTTINNVAKVILTGVDCDCVKGYFIETDISKISNISLSIIGQQVLNYDEAMLQLFCHKISDNLLYISLNGENNYSDMNIDSYSGSLNHSRIDEVKMIITFKSTVENLTVHTMSLKYLNYYSGMCSGVRRMPFSQKELYDLQTKIDESS